jgi:DNA-directed RNA polymerase specialized sigma subunit
MKTDVVKALENLISFALMGILMANDEYDKFNHFMVLVYVEDVIDKLRAEIVSRDPNSRSQEIAAATELMDTVRHEIRRLSDENDFDQRLEKRSSELLENWVKRPSSSV